MKVVEEEGIWSVQISLSHSLSLTHIQSLDLMMQVASFFGDFFGCPYRVDSNQVDHIQDGEVASQISNPQH
jgi:hypothetical protein